MIMWSEKLPNGKVRYVERYENPLTGKQCRVSITMDKDTNANRKTANSALQDKISAQLTILSSTIQKANLTLSELTTLYLADIKTVVKQSTYRRNLGAVHSILQILGEDVLVDKLNAAYVKKKLLEQNEKPGTTNERIVRFKTLIRWGYENEYIGNISWLDKLLPLKNDEKKKKLEEKFLEANELKLLLDNMSIQKWRYLTELMALSGMRCGEAIALTTADVDIENRLIHVNKTLDPNNKIITTPKTDDSVRDIYMQDQLLDLCKEIKKYMNKQRVILGFHSNHFLANANGEHLEYPAFNKYIKNTAHKVLGREITTHFLRHTHVALLAEQGVPLDLIARRLGHSDSEITKRIYFHVTEKLKERDNERIKNICIL